MALVSLCHLLFSSRLVLQVAMASRSSVLSRGVMSDHCLGPTPGRYCCQMCHAASQERAHACALASTFQSCDAMCFWYVVCNVVCIPSLQTCVRVLYSALIALCPWFYVVLCASASTELTCHLTPATIFSGRSYSWPLKTRKASRELTNCLRY